MAFRERGRPDLWREMGSRSRFRVASAGCWRLRDKFEALRDGGAMKSVGAGSRLGFVLAVGDGFCDDNAPDWVVVAMLSSGPVSETLLPRYVRSHGVYRQVLLLRLSCSSNNLRLCQELVCQARLKLFEPPTAACPGKQKE